MLINNPEALKSWLIIVLEPLCDADSSALARYVLALLKKDKPEDDLKKVMVEQLDVFLAEQTRVFVDTLFHAIKTEEYLKNPSVVLPIAKVPVKFTEPEEIEVRTKQNEASTKYESMQQDSNNKLAAEIKIPSTTDTLHAAANKINNSGSNLSVNKPIQPTEEAKIKDVNHPASSANSHKSVPSNITTIPPIGDTKSTNERVPTAHHSQNSKAENLNSSTSASLAPVHQHVRSASPTPTSSRLASNSASSTAVVAPNNDKENQPRESRRRRASLRSRTRSRSKSNERLPRRSRSRDRRGHDREKNVRQFRNKSPAGPHERRRPGGAGDRRRNAGSNNNTNDERSPRFFNNSGVSISAGGSAGGDASSSRKSRPNRSHSRSRSPSPDRSARNKSPVASRSVRTSPERHHAINNNNMTVVSNSINGPTETKRQRCRDFDEKGYCVRGETCPWDHGINPVVFEGLNNPALISMQLREYNPDSPDLWSRGAQPGGIVGHVANALVAASGAGGPGINPFTGNPRPSIVPPPAGFQGVEKTGGPPNPLDFVRNAAAAVAASGNFRGNQPMLPFPFNTAVTPLQRELIPIPVVDASGGGPAGGDIGATLLHQGSKRRFELEDTVAIADGPAKRKLPINSRLGPRVTGIQNNCSLELRKVPRGLNTISHLNNHFAKFGKITNITITYDNDPEAAIVTFSTHAEANVAYRSTEAVLNNRFIKVFWHTADNNQMAIDSMPAPITGRKNNQYHLNNVPALPAPPLDSAKTSNATPSGGAAANNQNAALTGSGIAATDGTASTTGTDTVATGTLTTSVTTPNSMRLKATPRPNAAIRKKQEEQAKAVVQLANGLRKRKQELLQSYLKQMKSALEIVERCEANDPQRAKTLETIKELQEAIDKLRKEIATEQEQIQAQIQNNPTAPPPPKKTKEQQKKELLDIELELFAQQQEGNDISSIQKRLEELQRSLGYTPRNSTGSPSVCNSPTIGKSTHFSSNRPNLRQRSTYPEGPTKVDRRPKTIVVTGFTSDEADFVLGHFKHFGEITKHDLDREIPQLILSYATRVNAEQAILRGKVFKEKRLHISWAPVVTAAIPPVTETPNAGGTGQQNNTIPSNEKEQTIATGDSRNIIKDIVAKNNHILETEIIPELRLEDEEEDEESEDRSWRR